MCIGIVSKFAGACVKIAHHYEQVFQEKIMPHSVNTSPIRCQCSLRALVSISGLPTGGAVVFLDMIIFMVGVACVKTKI